MNHFTPGPWQWQSLASDRGPEWTVLKIGGLTVEAPSDQMYIACHRDDQCLMTAAPALYEAVKELLDSIHDLTQFEDEMASVQMARAALSLAEGKEQA